MVAASEDAMAAGIRARHLYLARMVPHVAVQMRLATIALLGVEHNRQKLNKQKLKDM